MLVAAIATENLLVLHVLSLFNKFSERIKVTPINSVHVNRENKSNTNKFSVAIAGIFERYTYT
jgi:hypothetical protein